ncbi:MAG: metallophosphoesterase [archaeon]
MKKQSKKKTKILAVGDIHGDTGLVKKLVERAKKEDVDLVIIAGDLTLVESSYKNLIGPFTRIKKPVLLIHGNHESIATVDFLAEMYSNTKNLHGYSFKKDDLGIFGAGGADFGITQISDKKMFETLKKAHKDIKDSKIKIMITHMHPEGSKSEFSGFRGNSGIRKAIKEFKPELHIHGHIHEAEGADEKIGNTRVINVGKKGMVFEI